MSDGKCVAEQKIAHAMSFMMTIDETFDVGSDLRTRVDDNDYQVPFRFSGKLAKVTIKLGPEQLMAEDRAIIQRALATAHD